MADVFARVAVVEEVARRVVVGGGFAFSVGAVEEEEGFARVEALTCLVTAFSLLLRAVGRVDRVVLRTWMDVS